MLRVQHSGKFENNQLYDSVCHTSQLDITVYCIIVRILLLLNTNMGANILFISLNVTGLLKTDWTVAQGLFDLLAQVMGTLVHNCNIHTVPLLGLVNWSVF